MLRRFVGSVPKWKRFAVEAMFRKNERRFQLGRNVPHESGVLGKVFDITLVTSVEQDGAFPIRIVGVIDQVSVKVLCQW